MRSAIVASLVVVSVTLAAPALAQLERLSTRDASAGLKEALARGSDAAVKALGRHDGFLRNPKVRIPLPDSVQRADRLMRRLGMGEYSDELIVAMNRAAEAAVPEARQLLVDSVKRMTIADAKGILAGGDTAATAYFRRSTSKQLRERFLPIVAKATAEVGVARTYARYADRAASLGLVERSDADLNEYVTRKALDGLYFMIGEEEKKIRKDPLGAGSEILRKVFGAL